MPGPNYSELYSLQGIELSAIYHQSCALRILNETISFSSQIRTDILTKYEHICDYSMIINEKP